MCRLRAGYAQVEFVGGGPDRRIPIYVRYRQRVAAIRRVLQRERRFSDLVRRSGAGPGRRARSRVYQQDGYRGTDSRRREAHGNVQVLVVILSTLRGIASFTRRACDAERRQLADGDVVDGRVAGLDIFAIDIAEIDHRRRDGMGALAKSGGDIAPRSDKYPIKVGAPIQIRRENAVFGISGGADKVDRNGIAIEEIGTIFRARDRNLRGLAMEVPLIVL